MCGILRCSVIFMTGRVDAVVIEPSIMSRFEAASLAAFWAETCALVSSSSHSTITGLPSTVRFLCKSMATSEPRWNDTPTEPTGPVSETTPPMR